MTTTMTTWPHDYVPPLLLSLTLTHHDLLEVQALASGPQRVRDKGDPSCSALGVCGNEDICGSEEMANNVR